MGRLVCLMLALLIAPIAHADIQVENPNRTHGYFIGDILLQRVNLDSLTETIAAPSLESDLRVGAFLYRISHEEVTINKQQWLELRYQIINAPQQTETIELPSVLFVTEAGGEQQLPAWQFTVAPLTSTESGSESSPIADRRALDVIDTPSSDKFKWGVAALLTTLALWLLWWLVRHFTDSHTLPFAKAQRIIRKLPTAERDTDPAAWVALHHAFNGVAGKTITDSTQADLFNAAPWLSEHKSEIENFYAASTARFYQQNESQSVAVAALCSTLQRAEKRQAKQTKKTSVKLAS